MHRALLLAPLVLLTACSGGGGGSDAAPSATPTVSQPPVSAFLGTSCQSLAPSVLQIGRDAVLLGDGPTPAQDVRDRLLQAQDAVRADQPNVEPARAAVVQELVTAIGFARLASDTNQYTAEQGRRVSAAYDAVVASCTTPLPATSATASATAGAATTGTASPSASPTAP